MTQVSDIDFASFAQQAAELIGAHHVLSGADMVPFEIDFWK